LDGQGRLNTYVRAADPVRLGHGAGGAAHGQGDLLRVAMTLPETLVAGAIVGLVLIAVALGVATVRTDLKRLQVQELLAVLDEALCAYQAATGQWPAGSPAAAHGESPDGEKAPVPPRITAGPQAADSGGASADQVVAALAAVPASRTVVERIPAVLRVPPQGEVASPNKADWGTVQDAWGRRLECLTATSRSAIARQAVAANHDKPIFISAGVDGRFGRDTYDDADNLRSDELPR